MKKNIYLKALNEFKRRLLQELGEEVLELKLFGSRARGKFRKDSDIDVLVVLKSRSKRKKDFILDLTIELLYKYGVLISPLVYSKKEYLRYRRLPSIFLQIVEKEAVPL